MEACVSQMVNGDTDSTYRQSTTTVTVCTSVFVY